MDIEIIPYPNPYKRYVAGPGIDLATPWYSDYKYDPQPTAPAGPATLI